MFYFFQKGPDYLRCEIQALADGSFELLITDPHTVPRTEKYATSQQANKRWAELQAKFKEDGWTGPFGRE
jgi:hypothetical protein